MNAFFSTPSLQETRWGIRYLLFELLFLPSLLSALNNLLGTAWNITWLNVLFYGINFAAAVFLFRRFLKQTFAALSGRILHILKTAAILWLVYWVVMLLESYLMAVLFPDFVNVNDAGIAAMAADEFVPMAVSTILLVPVTEELLFRGALFGGLSQRHPKTAWVISILCFCLVHVYAYIGLYPWGTLLLCMVQYIPAGLILAMAYRRTGSILTPILIHAAVNFLGIFAMR